MVELETPTVEPEDAVLALEAIADIFLKADYSELNMLAMLLVPISNSFRNEVRLNKAMTEELRRMQAEVFAWRVCWALFGAFLVGVLVLTAIF